MNSRIFQSCALLGGLLMVSCYPYPEHPPQRLPQRQDRTTTISEREQQDIQAQQDRMRARDEARRRDQQQAADRLPPSRNEPTVTPGPKPAEPKKSWPYASAVPGHEGFVLSPYSNRKIDVRGIASGKLVSDPTYDQSEKKFFYVP